MEISEQLEIVRLRFNLSTHKFFNLVAAAISQKFATDLNMRLNTTGRLVTGTTISAILSGQAVSEDHEELSARVKGTMTWLKNPNNLLSLLR